jgi:hypothetical protein
LKIFSIFAASNGGLAQLARAFDWQSRGQGFDSLILHPEDQRVTEVIICNSFLFARLLPDKRGKEGKFRGKSQSIRGQI